MERKIMLVDLFGSIIKCQRNNRKGIDMIGYIWIGIILAELEMLKGWMLFWYIVCITIRSLGGILKLLDVGEK